MIIEQQVEKVSNQVVSEIRSLALDKFASRAEFHEESLSFPKDNFIDLHRAGLNAPTIDREYGGLGLGHHNGDVRTLWQMTTAIAMGDMSTARCWEGHNNALLLINNIASEDQKRRWFDGVVNDGNIWSVWSGEPQTKIPDQKKTVGTTVVATDDGYLLNGTKVFCSSATGASHAILLVSLEGPGGARHAASSTDAVMMLACDLSAPGISFNDAWWNPMGMRASVSYQVIFENVFIPKNHKIGYSGQFLTEEWQTRFTPQYAATFLGGAHAAYEYTKRYVQSQKKTNDPYIQHRLAKMAINLKTSELWLDHVAELWKNDNIEEAKSAGIMTWYLVEQLATETVNHALHACGARAMASRTQLERIYRDLSFYVRHDNDDHLLATVGKSVLGVTHDRSFFNASSQRNGKSKNGHSSEQ
ncbi:MAG: acyl-CoA/acyl-ACP dehydrogenase [Flavobacteriales bacterium]|nr:acyl-CoA/acyl-ACP dehydrogenase [Flavobacteriales bacterium]